MAVLDKYREVPSPLSPPQGVLDRWGGSDALVVGPYYQATAADLLPAARKADALVVGTHY